MQPSHRYLHITAKLADQMLNPPVGVKAGADAEPFQGATLVFDLLNCTLLSWLWVRQHGIERPVALQKQGPPDRSGDGEDKFAGIVRVEAMDMRSASEIGPVPLDPAAVFCERPHDRIDGASARG